MCKLRRIKSKYHINMCVVSCHVHHLDVLGILLILIFSSFHEPVQSRGVRRLSVNFLRKSLLLRDLWLDCDQTYTGWSSGERGSKVCSMSRSKSRSKGHVIRALLCWHENRFFFHANGCILSKLSLSVTFPSLCPFRFLPLPNPQMAASSLCEFRSSSQFTYRW